MNINQLKNIQRSFFYELESSAQDKKTSLPFIINTIPSHHLVKTGETFQTMVIGGTVFVNALLKKTTNGVKVLDFDKKIRPQLPTKKSFISFVASNLKNDVTILTINFAHALTPVLRDGRLDGILLFGSKENFYEGLIGKQVGSEIEKYVSENFGGEIKVALANDTVCIVLSGLGTKLSDNFAGGIVGTGLNFAFFLDETHLVNIESGYFSNFVQTETGKMIDEESNMKGQYLFEKEVSGAYLYKHFNLEIKKRNIDYPRISQSSDLDLIVVQNGELGQIAKEILERSASLVAAQIAGIVAFKKKNMTFVMQGSLFWKGYNYKETVEKVVKKLIPDYSVRFVHKEHADILGAARLVI